MGMMWGREHRVRWEPSCGPQDKEVPFNGQRGLCSICSVLPLSQSVTDGAKPWVGVCCNKTVYKNNNKQRGWMWSGGEGCQHVHIHLRSGGWVWISATPRSASLSCPVL